MISSEQFDSLGAGSFVALTLEGAITLRGYAARDPECAGVIRIDGLAEEDDGSVSRFSLRLDQSQIQAATILDAPPAITDSSGQIHRMQSGFWDTAE